MVTIKMHILHIQWCSKLGHS